MRWLGMIAENGDVENYSKSDYQELSWHHHKLIKNMDTYHKDSTLRYHVKNDAVWLLGASGLDPYGEGHSQINQLALMLTDRGLPKSFGIHVQDMGLGTEYEGDDIGTLSDWL